MAASSVHAPPLGWSAEHRRRARQVQVALYGAAACSSGRTAHAESLECRRAHCRHRERTTASIG
eukprot:2079731-Prymnesium_polylepis.1